MSLWKSDPQWIGARVPLFAEQARGALCPKTSMPAPQPTDERLSQESSEARQFAVDAQDDRACLHPRAAQALIRGGSW